MAKSITALLSLLPQVQRDVSRLTFIVMLELARLCNKERFCQGGSRRPTCCFRGSIVAPYGLLQRYTRRCAITSTPAPVTGDTMHYFFMRTTDHADVDAIIRG